MQPRSPREEWQSLKDEVTDTTAKRRLEKKLRDDEWEALLRKKESEVCSFQRWWACALFFFLLFVPHFPLCRRLRRMAS